LFYTDVSGKYAICVVMMASFTWMLKYRRQVPSKIAGHIVGGRNIMITTTTSPCV